MALFSGFADLLRELTSSKPLVLLLDDIDAADQATLKLVAHALSLEGRLLVVGTARAGRGQEEGSPYATFRQSLPEHPNQFLIELEPLAEPHALELVTELLGGFQPPPELVALILAFAGGNPAFVEAGLKHLVESGRLKCQGSEWEVAQALPDELPLSSEEVLRQQLKVIDPDLARRLKASATVGPNFEFNVLRPSLGKEDDETLDLVSDAIAAMTREAGAEQAAAPSDSERAGGAATEAEEPEDRVADPAELRRQAEQVRRERFTSQLRDRPEQVFDREAVEVLLGEAAHEVREATEAPPEQLQELLPEIAQALATGARVIRVYPLTSNAVKEAMVSLVNTLHKAHELAPVFTLGHRGNAFLLNGRPVDKAYDGGQHQEAVVAIYRVNSIKSLTFVKPPQVEELLAFLAECAKHTVQVPLERYFWRVFSKEHELRNLGIVQKSFVAKQGGRRTSHTRRPRVSGKRLAERDPVLVKELVKQLGQAVSAYRSAVSDATEPPEEAIDAAWGALLAALEHTPAVALHHGENGEALVVNGVGLPVKALAGGPELLHLLRELGLHGLALLKGIERDELALMLEQVALIAPGDLERGYDPLDELEPDALPHVIQGDGFFALVQDLVRKPKQVDTGVDAEKPATLEQGLEDSPPIEELLPLPERDRDLPPDFEWPSDAIVQKAHELYRLKPNELLNAASSADFMETMEMLLLEDREESVEVARRLIERMAVNFASTEVKDRARAADVFIALSKKGTAELRARFFAVAVRRLSDALELETDVDCFERLASAARVGALACIADGDWDTSARVVRSLGLRREARAEARDQLTKAGRRVLLEILDDPRTDRVFKTVETGSSQERRKAARVLESMGGVAVDRLVRALRETERERVETLLIDMLAALAPASEVALRKEVTPSSDPESTVKVLRAATVVCQDPTPLFVSGLQNPDQRVQTVALSEARKVGGKVAQSVLKWALSNGAQQVQLEAVRHLGELARADAVDDLLQLLQTSNLVEVQREACLSFGKLALTGAHHEKVVPVLAGFLRAGGFLRQEYHEDVRAAAAWSLGQMKNVEGARRALEKALDDKDKRVRLTAKLVLEGRSA